MTRVSCKMQQSTWTCIMNTLKPVLVILALSLFVPGHVVCWTYSSSPSIMNWTMASNYCRTKYTDLVAIQNEEEGNHLLNITDIIPHKRGTPHYWIGIRKINNIWTWVGTNKALAGNGSWAPNEPNSNKDNEDCVEIYIIYAGTNKGKWNDLDCSKNNYAICYKAQCTSDACSGQGECVETINSFRCLCDPGFQGSHCQTAVQCPKPTAPLNGWMECCGAHGNHFFGTTCKFGCQDGFRREGPGEMSCNITGEWSEHEPECSAISATSCGVVREPVGGLMNCSGGINDTLLTTCSFLCQPGFLLLGSAEVICEANGQWRGVRPVCAKYSHLLVAVLGWNVLSVVCCWAYCCRNARQRKKCHQNGSKHDRLNPAYDATGPLEEPLSP